MNVNLLFNIIVLANQIRMLSDANLLPTFNQFLRLRPFVAFAMKLVKVDMKPLLFFFVGCFDDEVDEEDGVAPVVALLDDLLPAAAATYAANCTSSSSMI